MEVSCRLAEARASEVVATYRELSLLAPRPQVAIWGLLLHTPSFAAGSSLAQSTVIFFPKAILLSRPVLAFSASCQRERGEGGREGGREGHDKQTLSVNLRKLPRGGGAWKWTHTACQHKL